MNVNDARKAGLLGGAMVGSLAMGTSAQDLPTTEGIAADVASRIGESSGGTISVGGGGGTVSTGGSAGGTISTGDITGGGDSQIGSTEGLAVADASGGNSNTSFVS